MNTPSTAPAPGTARGRRAARPARTWRLPVAAVVVAVIALAGMAVLLYPTAASWFSQLEQSRVIANSATSVDGDRGRENEQLRLAHAYNKALASGAVLDANQRLPTGEGKSSDSSLNYDSILKDSATGVMARLMVPSIGVDLPIYHGTSDETLLKGLGHLEGTSLPVGGSGTHSVITGHRGLANATMFTDLDRVKEGDMFSLSVAGEVISYRVINTQVVDPDQTKPLQAVPGKDLVTLVTCTPLGINSQRILVTGERVTPTPPADLEAAAALPTIPGFPWWAVILAGGLLLALVYVWRSGYAPRIKAVQAAS